MTQASIPELIAGVVGDAKDMAAGHATKARDEIKEEFSGLKQYLMMVLVGIGLGILGGILLSHAFALGLQALDVPLWLAYLIAAVIFVGVGVVLMKRLPSNKEKIDLFPKDAITDMKRDVAAITDDVKEDATQPVHAH